MEEYKQTILKLLAEPEKLLKKRPFTRQADEPEGEVNQYVVNGETIEVRIPQVRHKVISQAQFDKELNPYCHDVVFNENIPSLCVKVSNGDYKDVKFQRMGVAIQRAIKDKQTMHLSRLPMKFTLMDSNPSEEVKEDFVTFKQFWDLRNQDGMKTKMVDAQKSWGEAGLLYYFNRKGEIKSRLLCYKDGYILCPHNDKNGERLMETVYYKEDDIEKMDCYDDTYLYRFEKSVEGWDIVSVENHGFPEIPLVSKRGDVAWNDVQNIIEAYEELWNVFNAIQRRWGWGIFYVKGRFKDDGRNIAGNVVLNDTSVDGNGDAKFLTPPTPQGYMDTLTGLFKQIQLGSSTTFLFPEDIKSNGDVSATAAKMTKEFDIDRAARDVIDWQNVADKMVRLFSYGLSVELVNKGVKKTAITSFKNLFINAKFDIWQPFNENEYNTMIALLKGANLLSQESGIELNTLSKPDEKARVSREEKEREEKEMNAQRAKEEEGGNVTLSVDNKVKSKQE